MMEAGRVTGEKAHSMKSPHTMIDKARGKHNE
jgi:hypothetical protein